MAQRKSGGKYPKTKITPAKDGNPRSKRNFEFDSPLLTQGGRGDSWPQNEEISVIGGPRDPMGFIHKGESRPRGTRDSG